jgi:hypothetical protein
MTDKPRLAITYCRQCRWLLRASWMAQEMLTTFSEELGEVALIPGTGGRWCGTALIPSAISAIPTGLSSRLVRVAWFACPFAQLMGRSHTLTYLIAFNSHLVVNEMTVGHAFSAFLALRAHRLTCQADAATSLSLPLPSGGPAGS